MLSSAGPVGGHGAIIMLSQPCSGKCNNVARTFVCDDCHSSLRGGETLFCALQAMILKTQPGWTCCGSAAACTRATTPSTITPNASCTVFPRLPSQRPTSLNLVCMSLPSLKLACVKPASRKLVSKEAASKKLGSLEVRSLKLGIQELWDHAALPQPHMPSVYCNVAILLLQQQLLLLLFCQLQAGLQLPAAAAAAAELVKWQRRWQSHRCTSAAAKAIAFLRVVACELGSSLLSHCFKAVGDAFLACRSSAGHLCCTLSARQWQPRGGLGLCGTTTAR